MLDFLNIYKLFDSEFSLTQRLKASFTGSLSLALSIQSEPSDSDNGIQILPKSYPQLIYF